MPMGSARPADQAYEQARDIYRQVIGESGR
jgi:hypothetical protein